MMTRQNLFEVLTDVARREAAQKFTIERFHKNTDRYAVERLLGGLAKGWHQVDTPQDAPYYGQWTNPDRREIYTYLEGDHIHVKCENDVAYAAQIMESSLFDLKHHGKKSLVDMHDRQDVYWHFVALGLKDFVHGCPTTLRWELDWDAEDEEFVIQPEVESGVICHLTAKDLWTAIDIIYDKNYVNNAP